MTITTNQAMDPHSLEIYRDKEHVGYIQWHPNRDPRIVFNEAFGYLSLKELDIVLADYRRATGQPA